MMKMLVTSAALAALVATPAFAQTASKRAQGARAQVQQPYAQAPTTNGRHSTNPANDVYDSHGAYLGSDPDPTIRGMLRTDHGTSD